MPRTMLCGELRQLQRSPSGVSTCMIDSEVPLYRRSMPDVALSRRHNFSNMQVCGVWTTYLLIA